MADFNKGWYPKLAALQARCGEIGHTPGTFHDNGLGSTWFYCSKCGARTGIEGPNGEADARATGLKSEGEKP
jgi:hypothetical protein